MSGFSAILLHEGASRSIPLPDRTIDWLPSWAISNLIASCPVFIHAKEYRCEHRNLWYEKGALKESESSP